MALPPALLHNTILADVIVNAKVIPKPAVIHMLSHDTRTARIQIHASASNQACCPHLRVCRPSSTPAGAVLFADAACSLQRHSVPPFPALPCREYRSAEFATALCLAQRLAQSIVQKASQTATRAPCATALLLGPLLLFRDVNPSLPFDSAPQIARPNTVQMQYMLLFSHRTVRLPSVVLSHQHDAAVCRPAPVRMQASASQLHQAAYCTMVARVAASRLRPPLKCIRASDCCSAQQWLYYPIGGDTRTGHSVPPSLTVLLHDDAGHHVLERLIQRCEALYAMF